MTLKVANHLPYSLVSSNHRKGLKSTSHIFWPICHCHQQGGVISCLLPIGDTSLLVSLSYKTLAQKHQQSVLLSLRPNLGLEDPRGHLMKVLALALTPQALALALALREVLALVLARPRPRLFPHDPGHVVAVRVCCAHTHSVTW